MRITLRLVMSILDSANISTIYGAGMLANLYREFTKKTVFNEIKNGCAVPTMGGSFFGGIRKEAPMNKFHFRMLSSVCFDTLDQVQGRISVGELYYFKAQNQKYYKSMARRYFNLVKYQLYQKDRDMKNDVLWCFFPMYYAERQHLTYEEVSAFVLWFVQPPKFKEKAKLYEVKNTPHYFESK